MAHDRARHHVVSETRKGEVPEARFPHDDVEVGHYAVAGGVVIYVNQGSVCIFRERIALARDLERRTARERLALLRRLWSGEALPCSG